MKRFIGVALLSPSLLFGQPAEPTYTDIRMINGRSVDLAPVHQWYANPEGERPLKHWAKLTILEMKPSFGGAYLQCLVDTETGRQQVLFKTLPTATTQTVSRIQSLQTQITSLQQEIAVEEPIVERDEALYEGSVVRSSRLEVGFDYVTRRYDIERPSQRAINARLDRLALTEKKDLAAKLQEELRSLRQTSNANTILAMDTKRKYGGLSIWDMGVGGR